MSRASPPWKARKATASPGYVGEQFRLERLDLARRFVFRSRRRDEPQALVLRRERGRDELRPLAGLELEQRAAGHERRILDHLQKVTPAREDRDERVVGELGHRVLVDLVVGEAVALRHLLFEAVDLRLRVGQDEPVFVFADEEIVA